MIWLGVTICSWDPADGGVMVVGSDTVGELVGLLETGGGKGCSLI